MNTFGRLAAASLAIVMSSSAADAAYVINITQNGADVVATGSGSINLAGLSVRAGGGGGGIMNPSTGTLVVGSGNSTVYQAVNGGGAFGTTAMINATSNTGPRVGMFNAFPQIIDGYVSGTQFGTSTSVFSNTTLAGLGLKAGSYVWTWGRAPT